MQAKGRKNTYEHEANVLDMRAELEQPKDREDTHEHDYENISDTSTLHVGYRYGKQHLTNRKLSPPRSESDRGGLVLPICWARSCCY